MNGSKTSSRNFSHLPFEIRKHVYGELFAGSHIIVRNRKTVPASDWASTRCWELEWYLKLERSNEWSLSVTNTCPLAITQTNHTIRNESLPLFLDTVHFFCVNIKAALALSIFPKHIRHNLRHITISEFLEAGDERKGLLDSFRASDVPNLQTLTIHDDYDTYSAAFYKFLKPKFRTHAAVFALRPEFFDLQSLSYELKGSGLVELLEAATFSIEVREHMRGSWESDANIPGLAGCLCIAHDLRTKKITSIRYRYGHEQSCETNTAVLPGAEVYEGHIELMRELV